jgi:hypothetical protein
MIYIYNLNKTIHWCHNAYNHKRHQRNVLHKRLKYIVTTPPSWICKSLRSTSWICKSTRSTSWICKSLRSTSWHKISQCQVTFSFTIQYGRKMATNGLHGYRRNPLITEQSQQLDVSYGLHGNIIINQQLVAMVTVAMIRRPKHNQKATKWRE